MPKTRPSIPLNDGVLSTLRAGVKVSCEPPGVNAHRLLVLLVCGNVGGGGGPLPIAAPTESLHLPGDTDPQTRVLSRGRPRIMATSCSVTVVSPHERWIMCVSECHRSTSVINVAPSPYERHVPLIHVRGLCVRILSGDNHRGRQQ
jgi:hypothetical protein